MLDGHARRDLDTLDIFDGSLAPARIRQTHQVFRNVVRMILLGVLLILVLDLEEALALFAVVRLVRVVHAEHVLLEVRQL